VRNADEIEVRPFSNRQEYELTLDHFYDTDADFLHGMGVDRLKLPPKNQWLDALLADHEKPDGQRDRFYLVWICRGERIGHSSINKIVLGVEASIHLHMWNAQLRKAGLGTEFVRKSAGLYFQRFNLKKLICEPFAENPAPNRALETLGFTFVRRYVTTPGPISFEQQVNRYEILRGALWAPRSEVGSQKSEVRGQKLEAGSWKPEAGSRKSEVGSRKSEVSGRTTSKRERLARPRL